MKDKESNGRPMDDAEILVGYPEIVCRAAVEVERMLIIGLNSTNSVNEVP